MSELEHSNWKGNTGGTPWMQRFMAWSFRYLPLQVPYWCMGWVIPFYMLFAHKGYLAAYHFFRRRMGYNPLRAFWHVYLNHFRFGQVIIDRFAMFSGKTFQCEIDNYDAYRKLDQGEAGFVQVSSHTGNYELAGYSLIPERKSFNALVFSGETEQMQKGRSQMFEGKRMAMIPVSPDMSHIFAMNNVLAEGNIVSIPGDRVFGSPKTVECIFFGAKADFPLGPFAMAVQRGVEMLAVFCMKETTHRYRIFCRPLTVPDDLKRRDRMAALAQAFASELETVVRQYPNQWFNYFEFWKD